MEIDAELRRQIVVSMGAAAVFLAGLVAIGVTFEGDTLPEDGALALIGALTGFVLLMALVGLYLMRTEDAAESE